MSLLLSAIRLALGAIGRNKTARGAHGPRHPHRRRRGRRRHGARERRDRLRSAGSSTASPPTPSTSTRRRRSTRARGARPSGGSPRPTGARSRARRSASPASASGSTRRGRSSTATRTSSTTLIGTDAPVLPHPQVGGRARARRGRRRDELFKTKVCVIGADGRDEPLRHRRDPVGSTIRIGRFPYRVIGVLGARGTSLFGDDQDDRIMMPIGSFRARIAAHLARPRRPAHRQRDVAPRRSTRAKAQIDGHPAPAPPHRGRGQPTTSTSSTQAELAETTGGDPRRRSRSC